MLSQNIFIPSSNFGALNNSDAVWNSRKIYTLRFYFSLIDIDCQIISVEQLSTNGMLQKEITFHLLYLIFAWNFGRQKFSMSVS